MVANASTRFSNFSVRRARGILFTFALMMVLGTAFALTPGGRPHSVQTSTTDAQLYRTIITHTAQKRGLDGYYSAAIEAQRAEGYPVRPFVTVREPSLALASSFLGPTGTFVMFRVVGLLAIGAFILRLRTEVTHGAWIGASAAFVLSIAVMAQPVLALWHEAWAAFLVGLSLACRSQRKWIMACAIGLTAALVRELAAPYLVAMLLAALADRRREEAIGWLTALLLFAAALTAHAHYVAQHVTAADPMSPGWTSFGGWRFILSMVHDSGLAVAAPLWVTAVLLPLALLGWLAPATDFTDRVSLTLLIWISLFMLVGRPDNFYWGTLFSPLIPAGLAFAPRALSQLLKAAFPKSRTAAA